MKPGLLCWEESIWWFLGGRVVEAFRNAVFVKVTVTANSLEKNELLAGFWW
jgi:hypothetical protein